MKQFIVGLTGLAQLILGGASENGFWTASSAERSSLYQQLVSIIPGLLPFRTPSLRRSGFKGQAIPIQ